MPTPMMATFCQPAENGLAGFEGELLAIIDPAREFLAVEDDSGGDDRPRQRRAAGFVDAGQRHRKVALELEAGPRHGGKARPRFTPPPAGH